MSDGHIGLAPRPLLLGAPFAVARNVGSHHHDGRFSIRGLAVAVAGLNSCTDSDSCRVAAIDNVDSSTPKQPGSAHVARL